MQHMDYYRYRCMETGHNVGSKRFWAVINSVQTIFSSMWQAIFQNHPIVVTPQRRRSNVICNKVVCYSAAAAPQYCCDKSRMRVSGLLMPLVVTLQLYSSIHFEKNILHSCWSSVFLAVAFWKLFVICNFCLFKPLSSSAVNGRFTKSFGREASKIITTSPGLTRESARNSTHCL